MRRLLAQVSLSFLCCGIVAASDTCLILPFYNVAGDPNLDWIGESLAETIRESVVSYNQSAVNREDREEAAHALGINPGGRLTKASVIRLAQQVGAARVIYGRFIFHPPDGDASYASGSLVIRAWAIEVDRVRPGPEWEEAGALADLSQLQSRLSWRVLRYMDPAAAPSEEEFFESRPPIRIDAIEDYVRGLLAPDLEEKHRLFTLAVNLEPEFSQPSFQLGRMHWEGNSYRVASKWLERVKPSDAHYLEANFLLGLCRYRTGDFAGALAAFELVAQSLPADEVYNNIALAQFREGFPDAVENLWYALHFVPADSDYQFNAGYVLWRQGELDSAATYFREAVRIDPHDADALAMLDRCRKLSGPRRGDLSSEGLERLKENYEEAVQRWEASNLNTSQDAN